MTTHSLDATIDPHEKIKIVQIASISSLIYPKILQTTAMEYFSAASKVMWAVDGKQEIIW